jgi:hypothetical protein
LTSAVGKLVVEAPYTRAAAFFLLGNMIHENAHLYFLRKEKSSVGMDYQNLELSNHALIVQLETLLEELNKETYAIEMLKVKPVYIDKYL